MKTMTLKLPAELSDRLDALARKLKKNKSILVRLALQELLRQPEMADKLSAHDLLSPYIGTVKGLPKNLSSAANDLDGYGQ